MGTQINACSSHNLGVFWTKGAWFCYAICSPWINSKRDNGENGEPDMIRAEIFVEVARILPRRLSSFKKIVFANKLYTGYQRDSLTKMFHRCEVDGRDYNEIRRFIKNMAKQKLDASIG